MLFLRFLLDLGQHVGLAEHEQVLALHEELAPDSLHVARTLTHLARVAHGRGESGAAEGSNARALAASTRAASRQPRSWTTQVPSGSASDADATTWPTAPPVSGSPSANGGTYERTSFMRPRMYGSTETNVLRTST